MSGRTLGADHIDYETCVGPATLAVSVVCWMYVAGLGLEKLRLEDQVCERAARFVMSERSPVAMRAFPVELFSTDVRK